MRILKLAQTCRPVGCTLMTQQHAIVGWG